MSWRVVALTKAYLFNNSRDIFFISKFLSFSSIRFLNLKYKLLVVNDINPKII